MKRPVNSVTNYWLKTGTKLVTKPIKTGTEFTWPLIFCPLYQLLPVLYQFCTSFVPVFEKKLVTEF